MITVLKLGGSVITEKDEPDTVDWESLERATVAVSEFLADTDDDLVLVHGGGSFGHHHADIHGISSTDGTHDATALTDVHHAMGELNDVVLAALHERGVEALPVRPLSAACRDRNGQLRLPSETLETMLAEGFVPVVHGDVVAHAGKGGAVLSGDDIVTSLTRTLEAERVGLCSTVPGVLDDEGKVIPKITSYDDVRAVLDGSDATDVTGGMAGKVQTLLDVTAPASVFGLDALGEFFREGSAGTVVHSE